MQAEISKSSKYCIKCNIPSNHNPLPLLLSCSTTHCTEYIHPINNRSWTNANWLCLTFHANQILNSQKKVKSTFVRSRFAFTFLGDEQFSGWAVWVVVCGQRHAAPWQYSLRRRRTDFKMMFYLHCKFISFLTYLCLFIFNLMHFVGQWIEWSPRIVRFSVLRAIEMCVIFFIGGEVGVRLRRRGRSVIWMPRIQFLAMVVV